MRFIFGGMNTMPRPFLLISRILLLSLLSAGLLSCAGSKKATGKVGDDFVIFLEKTPCKGTCPYFNVVVNAKGQVQYEGKSFTDKIGIYQKQLKPKVLRALAAKVEASGYWEMNQMYDDARIADLPGCLLSVTHNGRTHQVLSKTGAPETFDQLVKDIEALIGTDGYTKISDSPY